MNQTIIQSPDTKELAVQQSTIVARATDMVVTNVPEHAVALLMLKDIATAEKAVKDLFEKPKKDAFQAHKSVVAAESKLLVPLGEARSIVTRKANAFEAEMERHRLEEEARLQEQARKDAEEAALQDAVLAEAEGDKAAAEEILAAPVAVPQVEVKPQVATMAGISSRTAYSAKVVDFMALVKYVVANPHEAALLQVNDSALNGRARSMRDGFKLPGCELVKETIKECADVIHWSGVHDDVKRDGAFIRVTVDGVSREKLYSSESGAIVAEKYLLLSLDARRWFIRLGKVRRVRQ